MQLTSALRGLTDQQLSRAIRRVAIILAVAAIAFIAFYAIDRWRAPATPIPAQQVTSLEQAVRDNPNDLVTRGKLADTYVQQGRFADALVQYDQIIATGQEIEAAKFGRAAAYMGLDRLDDALADYQAVVDIAKGGEMANVDPTLESAYYNLGLIALRQDRAADAVTYLESALRINRSDADALYQIGQAYTQTGKLDRAELALRRAVQFVPIGWAEPYTALATMFTQANKPAMAEWAGAMADVAAGKPELAEPRLLAIADSDAKLDVAIGLGLLYETAGNTASAAQWYAKALAIEPTNDAAMLGIGRVGGLPAATGAAQ
jgi:tetratricopeptide (TPR) repeat protein